MKQSLFAQTNKRIHSQRNQIPQNNIKSDLIQQNNKQSLDDSVQSEQQKLTQNKKPQLVTKPNQVIVNGYLVTLDEQTGQYKMQKIEEQQKKFEFKDQYFFHSHQWAIKKKQQLSISQQKDALVQISKGQLSIDSLNYLADSNQFPEMERIKSKSFRRNHNYQSVDLSQINQYNEQEILNQTLEKHIDGEIFIPKTLIDPGLLQAQAKLKLEKQIDRMKKDRQSPEIRAAKDMMSESQEAKINRNLFQIEKRLGLKKSDKLGILQQMLNSKQTQNNINLLENELKKQQVDNKSSQNQRNSELASQTNKTQLSQFIKDESIKKQSINFSPQQEKYSQSAQKFMNQRIFSQERSRRKQLQDSSSVQNAIKTQNYFSQGIFKSGLKESERYDRDNQKPISINEEPIQSYQNAEISSQQNRNRFLSKSYLRSNLFSNQSKRTTTNLNLTTQSNEFSMSKCHGTKVSSILSPKQKLIERLFETPKDEFLTKINYTSNNFQINQFLARKDQIKQLLIEILDQDQLVDDVANHQRQSGRLSNQIDQFSSSIRLNDQLDFDEQILEELFEELDQQKYARSKKHHRGGSLEQKKKSPSKMKDSFQSLEMSEAIDDDHIIKQGEKGFSSGKFELYNKYLNVLLLKNSDSYIQMMYQKYLEKKKKGKKHKQQNFYERMQHDILKRKIEEVQPSSLWNRHESNRNQSSNISRDSQSRLEISGNKFQRRMTMRNPQIQIKFADNSSPQSQQIYNNQNLKNNLNMMNRKLQKRNTIVVKFNNQQRISFKQEPVIQELRFDEKFAVDKTITEEDFDL
eukprot:403367146